MTSRFRSKLIVEDDGGFPFVLHEPLVYDSASLQRVLIVPAGFETDFASIPRRLWSVLPPVGKYDAAAVLHDALYKKGGVTRAQADGVLNEAMAVLGVGRLSRWIIYAGVRTAGWVAWSRYREADHAAV